MNPKTPITSVAELSSRRGQSIRKIKIADNLTAVPAGIFHYANSLEVLDLSNNQIAALPDNFSDLKQLKILFLSDNCFTEFPQQLFACPHLSMIGFKANRINKIAEHALPRTTRWLILTDNEISQLPEDIGALVSLQKCMLAGNALNDLPKTLQQCQSLQLLRISANEFTQFPSGLEKMPSLSWLALAGNPFSSQTPLPSHIPAITKAQLNLGELLGEGASGHIYKAIYKGSSCAVKLFKGEVTSDGYPQDELLACLSIPEHPNLVKVKACIQEQGAEIDGVLMELIPTSYTNFGLPPSLESCTRDTFDSKHQFNKRQVGLIIKQMADVLNHIHTNQFMHGDVYAHNVLVDAKANLLFSDFGAASSLASFSEVEKQQLLTMEYRAFSYFVEDVFNYCAGFNVNDLAEDHVLRKVNDMCQKMIAQSIANDDFLEKIVKELNL